jgi:pimeloyl-ACP methyl ester carboxylesterase
MKKLVASIAIASAVLSGSFAMAAEPTKPTFVSIHGAFADNSSWNGVVKILQKDGYTVAAASNPLRSVKADADYVANIVAGIKTPVVLVGHSYGGLAISEAAFGKANVKALVFVSAFAPEAGETAVGLSGSGRRPWPNARSTRNLAACQGLVEDGLWAEGKADGPGAVRLGRPNNAGLRAVSL